VGSSFQEYYLVLALGLKDEQSLWLGAANVPADAPQGKHVRFILTKIGAWREPESGGVIDPAENSGPLQSQ
jgi:hypothetical protein